LGILVQVEEGQYYLEDPSGRVQVSFCNAVAADSFFVLENSILLVEATFQDEILFIERVGPPFIEQRQKSLQMLQQQVRHNHFLPSEQFADDHPSYVVLSDVHLDQPRVLNFLEGLFQSYATDLDPSDLPLFCLMGNFTSNPQIPAYQAWEELAILIAKYPFLAQHAQFVFIPGPRDTKSTILPQTSILQSTLGLKRLMQSYQIENVHLASNPCRIRQNGKEIVLFRHDILSWMLQNQVRLPLMDGTEDRTPHSKMVKTILDQGHLMPVARAPIYWNYDHALRLYPLPDAFILGCSSAMEDYEIYEGCDAIKPGSFAKNGTYARFSFADNDAMDTSASDGEESGMNTRVDFCQVKETES
jgi:DNA polymerase epsilon subunit 2